MYFSLPAKKISIKKFDKQTNLSHRHGHENLGNIYLYSSWRMCKFIMLDVHTTKLQKKKIIPLTEK